MSEKTNEKLSHKTTTKINIVDGDNNDEIGDDDDKQDNAALDVTSPKFDALHALYAENFQITNKKPKVVYQNLAAFESALKKCGIWGLEQRKPQPQQNMIPTTSSAAASAASAAGVAVLRRNVQELPITRNFLPNQMPVMSKTKRSERHKNVLQQMNKQAIGPMSILLARVTKKQRVHVKLRNEHGVRGYIEGVLICFDMHWNLLLRDVTEVWQRRKYKYSENKAFCGEPNDRKCEKVLRDLGIKLPESTLIKSLNRKNVQIQRKLPQLFVRGEQVVLVQAHLTSNGHELGKKHEKKDVS